MIRLIDVARFYDALPHQDAALEFLQQQIPSDALAEFARMWRSLAVQRSEPPPNDSPRTGRSGLIELPGRSVYLDDAIVPNGAFTWAEALHDGERIPRTKSEVANILSLAQSLQAVRLKVGRPMLVTSWYRPDPYNARVGGAKHSLHKDGRAVDLRVEGMSGRDLARIIRPIWGGGLGIYGDRPRIIHLDIGALRSWGI
jgi:hypothetical protein